MIGNPVVGDASPAMAGASPKLFGRHPNSTQRSAPAQPSDYRLRRINARVADIAWSEALKDAKRAMLAKDPGERAELRASAALLREFSKAARVAGEAR